MEGRQIPLRRKDHIISVIWGPKAEPTRIHFSLSGFETAIVSTPGVGIWGTPSKTRELMLGKVIHMRGWGRLGTGERAEGSNLSKG